MTIYAKQVPPEYQESPLFWDGLPEGLEIHGNGHFQHHTSELFTKIMIGTDYAADALFDFRHGERPYNTWAEALADLFPREEEYTRAERLRWRDLLSDHRAIYDNRKHDIRAAALSLITGQNWQHCILRGCCQSEWQTCYYCADLWDGDSLERLEREYFNTGTEWIVHDDETPPDSPEEINGFSVYCHGWNDDQHRAEIAEAAGGSPEAVKLYKFAGFTRIAQYEEV